MNESRERRSRKIQLQEKFSEYIERRAESDKIRREDDN